MGEGKCFTFAGLVLPFLKKSEIILLLQKKLQK